MGGNDLQQSDACLFAGFYGVMIPDTGLNLADMGAAHHQHSQTALADTAADGQGQLVIQQHPVEGKLPAVITAGFFQLIVQCGGIHADTHGGDLQSTAQDFVPEEDVAV